MPRCFPFLNLSRHGNGKRVRSKTFHGEHQTADQNCFPNPTKILSKLLQKSIENLPKSAPKSHCNRSRERLGLGAPFFLDFGGLLGGSRRRPGASWAASWVCRASWGRLGGVLAASWRRLWVVLGTSCASWVRLGAVLGPSWDVFGARKASNINLPV